MFAKKTLTKKEIQERMEENEELDLEYIARLVQNGVTSGVIDNEAGYKIVWELKIEKFIE